MALAWTVAFFGNDCTELRRGGSSSLHCSDRLAGNFALARSVFNGVGAENHRAPAQRITELRRRESPSLLHSDSSAKAPALVGSDCVIVYFILLQLVSLF
ncbi:hypothetical protein Acr_05g0005830 [Actinidia rufa]|uniref:Uncharacterized protein n=1 Tax=Actinidia rufa TaxID=165716 RepID=A0A7J0EKF6_9ERIC|nr:hypothetical protein Acr_05g0005830 [Actinidia rufa]